MNKLRKTLQAGGIFPWERDFTREFFGVAVPIVIQTLFMASMHIIDNVMIGQLGEVELAAVTQANRITFLFQLVVFGLTGGASTFVAQYWGKQDLRGIRTVMGLSMCLSLVAALCFLIPCVIAPAPIMRLLLKDEAAVAAAVEYLPIIAFGYLGTALAQCYATVQKSTEQARLPMFADIAGLLVNTFLNYCLIFGNLGFPRLGVQGGAIATVTAICVTLLIVILGGYRMKLATAAKLSELIPRSAAFAKKYLTIALPVIANEGLWSLGMVMYSVVYGRMGTGTVAAVSIYNSVEQIAFSTIRGITSACAVLVGKRIGAGDEPGAYQAAKRMLFASVPSGLFASIVLLLVSVPLVQLFNVSETVAQDARTLVTISACFIWFHQLGGLFVVGILRAGGDVRMSLYLDVGTTWLIGVPLVSIAGLALGLSIPYVFAISQMEALVKVSLGFWRFRSRKWIHNLVR